MARRRVKVVKTCDCARACVIIQKGRAKSSSPKLGQEECVITRWLVIVCC